MTRRISITVLSVIVFAIAAMIFSFSAQSGEESGKLSGHISEPVVRIIYRDYDRLSADEQSRIMQAVQHIVRKTAHFSEYALLGFFSAFFSDSAAAGNPACGRGSRARSTRERTNCISCLVERALDR